MRKKGGLRMTICCLGVLLAANVSCALNATNEPARAEQVAPGQETGEAVAAKDQEKAALAGDKRAGMSAAQVRRVPANAYQYQPDTSKNTGTEILLGEMAKEVAGKVYYEMQGEGDVNFTGKIAVVNAVPLSDFKRETEFGRVMGEYLLTDLADRGLKVTELRLGKDITILPQTGEFILSRNIGELANKMPELEYVVVTTFANTHKTLIVQGRLVRLQDGLVKTSWRYSLPLTRELLGLFQAAEAPYKIAVKGIGR